MPLPTTTAQLLFRVSVAEAGGTAVSQGLVDSIKDLVSGTDLLLSGDSKASWIAAGFGGPNQQPCMDFGRTGNRDYSANLAALQTHLAAAASPYHILSVCYGYPDGDEPGVTFVAENTASGGFANRVTSYFNARDAQALYRGISIRGDAANGVQAEATGFTANTWHLLESTYDGNIVSAQVDGGTAATLNVGDAALSGVAITRIGARIAAGAKARQLRGRLAEVLVFDRVLSTADRGAILYHLNSTYGLAVPGAVAPVSTTTYTGKARAFGLGPWGAAGWGTWRREVVGGRVSVDVSPRGNAARNRAAAGRSSAEVVLRGAAARNRAAAGQVAALAQPRGGARRSRQVLGRVQILGTPMGKLVRVARPSGRVLVSPDLFGGASRVSTVAGRLAVLVYIRARLRETWDRPAAVPSDVSAWQPRTPSDQGWTDRNTPAPPTWANRPDGEK